MDKPFPINTAVIIAGSKYKEEKCEFCKDFFSEEENILLEGFEEFYGIEKGIKGFLGFDTRPLFCSRKDSQIIASKLSGTKAIPVGYYNWEQGLELPKEQQFPKEPLLGAVIAMGRCDLAYWPDGEALMRCEHCHSMYFYENNNAEEKELLLDFNGWDKSDFFKLRLYAASWLCITENGIDILKSLEFDNLIFKEIFWKE